MATQAKRYKFWIVFLVVLSINVPYAILQYLVIIFEGKESPNYFPEYIFKQQIPSIIFVSLIFYLSLNLYNGLIKMGKRFYRLVLSSIPFLFMVTGFYVSLEYFLPLSKDINDKVYWEEVVVYFVIAVFMIGLSITIAYIVHFRDEKKKQILLEQQKMQLEIEKAYAQLNFLKAQINPHFLHNTLSFLYVKALPLSSELSDAIMTLSDVMRYALSENATGPGKVPLQEEIEHLHNVIKVNQLRFNNDLNLKFEVKGLVEGFMVPPFVLITVVENAFKHGDLRDPAHPIHIALEVVDQQLSFWCKNKKKTGPKETTTGIGLNNIKKQLDLIYGDSYELKVTEDALFYTSKLIIRNQ